MAETSQTPAERAREIVARHEERLVSGKFSGRTPAIDLEAAITAALTIPANHIRDEHGTNYRVKFKTPAGSPSPLDNSTPFIQFYCEKPSTPNPQP